MTNNAVVFFSGGITSWAAGKRVAMQRPAEEITLLFTDTLIEDPDLYRFLPEAADNIGAEFVVIADGRTPWQVFHDEKMLGNSRIDPCSKILKRQLAERWLRENRDPAETTLVFGLDWTEARRFDDGAGHGVKPRWGAKGYQVEAPMMLAPYMGRGDVMRWLREEGIRPPRLYDMGFAHNNCGGGCIKAGLGHFAHLLKTLPKVYAEWERGETEFNAARPGKRAQTILRRQIDGQPTQLVSLADLREEIEARGTQATLSFEDEIGGCGCFVDEPEEAAA